MEKKKKELDPIYIYVTMFGMVFGAFAVAIYYIFAR